MIIKKSVLKILFFTILLALSACSNKKFKLIDKEEKTAFLSSKPVFDSRVLAEMSGTISETPSHSSSSSTGTVSEGGSANGANTSAGSGNIGTGIGGTNTGTGGGSIGTGIGGINTGTGGGSIGTGTGGFNTGIGGGSIETGIGGTNNGTGGGSIGTGIGGINTGFGGGSIGTGSSNNIIVNPNPTQAIGTGANSIPFNFICSYRRTTNNQGNVKESTKPLTIVFTDQNTNNELCRMTSSNIKDTLLNERRLLIPDSCNKLTPNSKISVTLFESPNQNFIYSSYEKDTVKYYGNLDGIWLQNGVPHLYVLLDRNIDNFEKPEGIDPCDKRSSPLFVDLGTNETLALSPPSKGIFFNILGRNSFPQPNMKKKISWFNNEKFMFLVNPSKSGLILGVDQMFGDNTLGPDGKFSTDGFMALAKYDSNRDGIIDYEDPIFEKLRLWSDSNGDGIAEPGELLYLDFMNVNAIDLAYDPNYYEKDIYGNEIHFKSIVQLKDGSIKLMFDLWFRYL